MVTMLIWLLFGCFILVWYMGKNEYPLWGCVVGRIPQLKGYYLLMAADVGRTLYVCMAKCIGLILVLYFIQEVVIKDYKRKFILCNIVSAFSIILSIAYFMCVLIIASSILTDTIPLIIIIILSIITIIENAKEYKERKREGMVEEPNKGIAIIIILAVLSVLWIGYCVFSVKDEVTKINTPERLKSQIFEQECWYSERLNIEYKGPVMGDNNAYIRMTIVNMLNPSGNTYTIEELEKEEIEEICEEVYEAYQNGTIEKNEIDSVEINISMEELFSKEEYYKGCNEYGINLVDFYGYEDEAEENYVPLEDATYYRIEYIISPDVTYDINKYTDCNVYLEDDSYVLDRFKQNGNRVIVHIYRKNER